MTDVRELLARLNPTHVRLDTGRGGVPTLTNQDIAAALAFVPAGVGRELLIACWWPEGAAAGSVALRDAVYERVRPEVARQTRGLMEAKIQLGMVLARAGWVRSPDAETRRDLATAQAALDSAKDRCWPSATWEMLPALTRAVVSEIARLNHCSECRGRCEVRVGSLLAPCKTCGGAGVVPISDRKRADAIGRDESTYRAKWRPVYEWLLSELRDAEREAARALVKAVGVRD